eukprot:EG_transcript_15983
MLHALLVCGVACTGIVAAPALGGPIGWPAHPSSSSSASSSAPPPKARPMRPLNGDDEPQAICGAMDVAKIALGNYQGQVRPKLTMVISTCCESWGVNDDCVNYYTRKELGLGKRCRTCVVDLAHCVRSWCWMYCWKKDPRTGFRRPTCFSCISELCEKSFRRCALPGWMNQVDEELDNEEEGEEAAGVDDGRGVPPAPPASPAPSPAPNRTAPTGSPDGTVPPAPSDTGQPPHRTGPAPDPGFALPTFGLPPALHGLPWRWPGAASPPTPGRPRPRPTSELEWPQPADGPAVWHFRWPWTQEETVEVLPPPEAPPDEEPTGDRPDPLPNPPAPDVAGAVADAGATELLPALSATTQDPGQQEAAPGASPAAVPG